MDDCDGSAYALAMRDTTSLLRTTALLLACVALLAGSPPALAEQLRVYTNADLERLEAEDPDGDGVRYANEDLTRFGRPSRARGSEPAAAAAPAYDAQADWAFVQAALDREQVRRNTARIEALESELARLHRALGASGWDGDDGELALAPFPWFFGRHPRPDDPDSKDPDAFVHGTGEPPLRRFLSQRRTLFSAPPVSHGAAAELRGHDAFPGGRAHRR